MSPIRTSSAADAGLLGSRRLETNPLSPAKNMLFNVDRGFCCDLLGFWLRPPPSFVPASSMSALPVSSPVTGPRICKMRSDGFRSLAYSLRKPRTTPASHSYNAMVRGDLRIRLKGEGIPLSRLSYNVGHQSLRVSLKARSAASATPPSIWPAAQYMTL